MKKKKIISYVVTIFLVILMLWLVDWLMIHAQEVANFFFKHNIVIPNILKALSVYDLVVLLAILLFIVIAYKINVRKVIRKCPECGEEVKKESGYCGKCGEKLPSVKTFIIGAVIGFVLLLITLAIESEGRFKVFDFVIIELTLISFALHLPVYKD